MNVLDRKFILGSAILTLAALVLTAAQRAQAQTLVHRYSFNGNANDSVGSANGTVIGSGVTFQTSTVSVNGSADFSGGATSSGKSSYISLPLSAVSNLQNGTIEIFTTNFNPPKNQPGVAGGQYQTLFTLAQAYGTTNNFINITPDFYNAGIGFSGSVAGSSGNAITAHDPLPDWRVNHVLDIVFSGFTSVGSTGTVTLYRDGQQTAQGQTTACPAAVAAASGGVSVCGIGGGSAFNDPNFSGSIDELRIYDSALTPAQIAADVSSGPAQPAVQPAPASITGSATASPNSISKNSASSASAITASISDSGQSVKNTTVEIEVLDPSGQVAGQQLFAGTDLAAGGPASTFTFNWTAPSTPGAYTVVLGVLSADLGTKYYWNASAATVTVQPPTAIHSFGAGIQLISMPYDFSGTDPSTLLGSPIKLAVWNPGGGAYAMSPNAPADSFKLGQGYWTRVGSSGAGLYQYGTAAPAGKAFTITLTRGWNMIGDPFTSPVVVGGTSFTPSGSTSAAVPFWQAEMSGLISPILYAFSAGATGYTPVHSTDAMQPYAGYWIHVNQNMTMTLPAPSS